MGMVTALARWQLEAFLTSTDAVVAARADARALAGLDEGAGR